VGDKPRRSGFKIIPPEPSPEYKQILKQRQKYDTEGDLIDHDNYHYKFLTSDPGQYKKIRKKTDKDRLIMEVYKNQESPIMKKFYKNNKEKTNPFLSRKSGGVSSGPPPKKGPQPQGINKGGTTDGAKFVKFFGEQFNQNKDKVLKEALTGVFKRDFKSRFKNRMNQAFTDFEKQNKGSSYGNNFTGYNPKKEETGITTKETMGLKKGGMGCPHREMGAKSDIQGVKDIQLTGKSFKGVK